MDSIFLTDDYTCVVYRDGSVIYKSRKRGIKPLVEFIDSGIDGKNATAEDKIVGKAAALLYVYIGVTFVRAKVMSKSGLYILRKHGINTEYEVLTDKIINHSGTGICPMEEAVALTESPEEGLISIKTKLVELRKIKEDNKNMNRFFDSVKENFGFGCMRLPMLENGEVDLSQFSQMIKEFLDAGFNYFDTAHGYIDGKSELAIKDCLTSKYPRDKYILTDKLTNVFFHSEEDIDTFFESQLKLCGVEYFDFYLMHAQNREIYKHFKKYHAYEHALRFREEGKIKHFGISFHDTPEFLEEILTEYPEVEVVQIQFNYVDYDDPVVQSRKLLEVCEKYGKPAIIMEPVKGGSLVKLPDNAQKILDNLNGGSNASYAIRFCAGFSQVMMVLSGMSNLDQLRDNISFMKDFTPLDDVEKKAVKDVCDIFRSQDLIPCTSCRYCTAGCPKHISIPDIFGCMNSKKMFNDWNADYYYNVVHTGEGRKASDCIRCGKCEKICPQHLEIRKLLEKAASIFEKK